MCDSFYFNLMIMTLLSSFQTLLKEKEVAEDVHTEAALAYHFEGAINLEVMKIASEHLMTSNGLDVAETILRESTDGADQPGEVEV
jgi:hypothetical protein